MADIETKKNGRTFAQWKDEVERIVVKMTGVDCDSLPDWGYCVAWSQGKTPLQAARSAVRAAGTF